ncbi:MAG: hypothetical protein OEZ38_00210 [Gammaproteobacteria bacterium]|nr:hypothetical protein [Gammaproteobacteria bacterium]
MQNFKPCIDISFDTSAFRAGGRVFANVLTGAGTVYAVLAMVDFAEQILPIQEIGELFAYGQ